MLPYYAAANEDELAFLMSLSLDQLGEISVESATLQSEKLADTPASAIVITAKEIKERGYLLFADLLRDIPGVDLVHVNGTYRSIFSQRGTYTGENNRSLILIDGVVESNILEGSLLHGGQYSLHDVAKVEVIYGPASALYGANAFGGIISITTKGYDAEQSLSYRVAGGAWSTQYHAIKASHAIGDVKFSVAAHRYDSDGFTPKNRGKNYSNSYVDNAWSLQLQLNYHDYQLGYNKYVRPTGLGTFSNLSGFEGINASGVAGPGLLQSDFNGEPASLWNMHTETAFAKGRYQISPALTMQFNVFARESAIALNSYSINYIPASNSLVRNAFGHVSDTLGADLRFNYHSEDDWNLIWGVSWDHSDIERGYRSKFTVGEELSVEGVPFTRVSQLGSSGRVSDLYRNIAAYAQFKKSFDWYWPTKVTLGARYDYNNQYGRRFGYGETFNPRLGLVSELNSRTRLKLLYGTAYRAPTSFDRFTATEVRIANPDLLPETLDTLEVILTRRFSQHWYGELSVYRNRFENAIISNVDTGVAIPDNPNVNYTQNQNAGSGRATGLEGRLNLVYGQFEGFANLTWQDASQELLNQQATPWPNIASVKGNLGVTWHLSEGLSLYVSHNWVGSRDTASTNIRQSVAGYHLSHLNLTWQNVLTENDQLSFRVDNLWDNHWLDPGIRTADETFYASVNPQPGRSWLVKYQLQF